MVFWYLLNEYNEEKAFYWVYKKFKNQIHTYLKFFEIKSETFKDQRSTVDYFYRKLELKYCLYCGNEVTSRKKDSKYCSIKCSNNHKIKNKKYLENLSNGLKNSYRNMSMNQKELRKKEISKGNKRYYKNQTLDGNKNTGYLQSYSNLDKSLKYYGDYSILTDFENYKKDNSFVLIKCNYCKETMELKRNTSGFNRPRCECNRKDILNYPENELYEIVKKGSKDVCFLQKGVIGDLELDITDLKNNFAIEYNGLYWHSSLFKEKNYHLLKTQLAEEKGIKLFHIFENEWLNAIKKKIWIYKIKSEQGLNTFIHSEYNQLKEISKDECIKFLDENCLEGFKEADFYFGLVFENEIILALSFKETKKDEFEIVRMCTKVGIEVVNGYDTVLDYFSYRFKPIRFHLEVNRRLTDGKEIEKLGFANTYSKGPSLFYFITQRELITEKESHKILSNYNKIYDSGSKFFEKIL